MLINEDDINTLAMKMIELFEKKGLTPILDKKVLKKAIALLDTYSVNSINFELVSICGKQSISIKIKSKKVKG